MDLSKYSESQCSCYKCQKMCYSRPCTGTPDDIKKIIAAGFKNKLMLDWWASTLSQEIDEAELLFLSPAIVGHENQVAPMTPIGRCAFLTDEGRCELHALGLKPIGGRLATCNHNKIENQNALEIFQTIVASWDTKIGKQLISEVNISQF